MKKEKTVEGRAVEIASIIMQAAGLCRYDSVDKCRHVFTDKDVCARCIKKWLLSKARAELSKEGDST